MSSSATREVLQNLFTTCNNANSVSQLHSLIIKTGLLHDSVLATELNKCYVNYTSLNHARKLFDETPHRSVYLCNSMLKSYFKDKQYEETLHLFNHMILGNGRDSKPDNFTIPIVLKACARLHSLRYGTIIHGFVKKCSDYYNVFVGAALIELYSRCGKMSDALKVFQEFDEPDNVLRTSMVSGYEKNGFPDEAVGFFAEMGMTKGLSSDEVMLISLVSACTQLGSSKLGRCVHGFVKRRALDTDLSLANALLNLYAKTSSLRNAGNMFRFMKEKDVISRSIMIACCGQSGNLTEALEIFNEMIRNGDEMNSVTVVSLLQACAVAVNLEEGKRIYSWAAERGFELEPSVSTALVDMYMKCSSPDEAVYIFKNTPNKDVISWVTLLNGYVLNGMAHKSMSVFRDMLLNDCKPDAIAIVKILTFCAELGVFQQALCLHGYIFINGFNNNMFVGASLVELYSKCGSLENAIKVFNTIPSKDVVIWSAMINGYGMHGQGRQALNFFDKMLQNSSVRPNNVMFLSVLSACSHAGLIEEGFELFDKMINVYGLTPSPDHYGIMVDLLGRKGELDEAIEIINQMPGPAGPDVWGALLGACRIHRNTKIGELAARNLFSLDSNHGGYHLLVSEMYSNDGKWDSVENIRSTIKKRGLKKTMGQSVVEIRNEVHSFVADDGLHPKCDQIHEVLRRLEVKMIEEGYAHGTNIFVT